MMERRSVSAESRGVARLLGQLGLAARAGRLRVGMDAVEESVRRGEARAVIVAADASAGTERRIGRLLSGRPPGCKVVVDGDRLGHAVGRSRVVVVAVTDSSLARRVLALAGPVEG